MPRPLAMSDRLARSRDRASSPEASASAAAGRLTAATVAVTALRAEVRAAMWALFSAAYDDVTRAGFERDLAAKEHVILLHDAETHALAGFSTLQTRGHRVGGRRIWSVFSGDTIVDRRYWGQTALQRAFLAYVIRQKLRHPFAPLYWFLISKGYKTYLLLSRNFPEHWPRAGRATPPRAAAILDVLARERFPEAWRPELGVLCHPRRAGRLREAVAPVDSALLAHADVRFFCERNPGHARGDELCAIGRVDAWLWLSYMGKLARRVLRPRFAGARPARTWTESS